MSISIQAINQASTADWHRLLQGPAETLLPWLETAAEEGILEAQLRLAHMLLAGQGCTADAHKAFEWFKSCANADMPMGMNMLGRCYENGWGTPSNLLLATYWFHQAAKTGLDWGMYNYATSLALGRGTEVNLAQAYHYLELACQQDHAKSWNLLGSFYEDGWHVSCNLVTALSCYERAAQGGDFRGYFNAGRLQAEQGLYELALSDFQQAYSLAHAQFRVQMDHYLRQHSAATLRTAWSNAARLTPH